MIKVGAALMAMLATGAIAISLVGCNEETKPKKPACKPNDITYPCKRG